MTPFPRKFFPDFVEGYFQRRDIFLESVKKFGSPQYFLETDVLKNRAAAFRAAFERTLPMARCYFAMKSNNMPAVSKTVLEEGFGLDVSSGLELKTALELGANDILFSGPGKTDQELELAADHPSAVTILIDSMGELRRLKTVLKNKNSYMRAGLRLNNNPEGLWRKFGVSLEEIENCFKYAAGSPHINLCGLQFHSSWNMEPGKQIDFIGKLGRQLHTLPSGILDAIEFIDIGGGYWPPQGEWLLNNADPLVHEFIPGTGIDIFAQKLADALKQHVLNRIDCTICLEPGRWICNDAMHILLSVIDCKAEDLVITDAGTNAIGWERFESDYFPVLNLTRPGIQETPCHILGSLCTPHDVWGYAFFGETLREGDILMIPTQGAYTYSMRQQFIKPLPRIIIKKSDNTLQTI